MPMLTLYFTYLRIGLTGVNLRHFTFLHVQAEEADVDAVDLLEGVEGALPEGERLLHLSRVDEPAMNRVSVD